MKYAKDWNFSYKNFVREFKQFLERIDYGTVSDMHDNATVAVKVQELEKCIELLESIKGNSAGNTIASQARAFESNSLLIQAEEFQSHYNDEVKPLGDSLVYAQ